MNAVRAKKEQEFIELEQGDATVDVYQARFSALSRFAPHMVRDEERKVARFQRGLRYSIGKQLIPLKLTSYDEAVSTAQLIEQGDDDNRRRMGDPRGKGKASYSQPSSRVFGKGKKRTRYEGRIQNSPACERCGKENGRGS